VSLADEQKGVTVVEARGTTYAEFATLRRTLEEWLRQTVGRSFAFGIRRHRVVRTGAFVKRRQNVHRDARLPKRIDANQAVAMPARALEPTADGVRPARVARMNECSTEATRRRNGSS
jgi:hypothetical protein